MNLKLLTLMMFLTTLLTFIMIPTIVDNLLFIFELYEASKLEDLSTALITKGSL